MYILPFLAWGGFTFFSLGYVLRSVEFKPRVDENFFFSSDDPQLRTDRLISKMFDQEEDIIISAEGDIRSPVYLRRISAMTGAIAALPGVDIVDSLSRGPGNADSALKSPLWKRVLFSKDKKTSFIYVFFKKKADIEGDMREIEKLTRHFHSPHLKLRISGAPYIVELIQRNLLRDLKVFTIAAFCVFGISGLLISRSAAMVFGTLVACTNAGALTLTLTHRFGIPIGPLTANLSTIVFVLTLTHMVFMTFNWRHIVQTRETSVEKAWLRAVRVTLAPSLLSMLTALLGFLSLLSVPAAPLRELGLSGALGTVVAFLSAYIIYPFFLSVQTGVGLVREKDDHSGEVKISPFFRKEHSRLAAAVLLAAAAAATGLWRLDTRPGLFSYFKKGSDVRESLEYVDRNGGSVPLTIAVANADGTPLNMREAYPRLWRLQDNLERDPAVGTVMSLTLILAEAKNSFPRSLIPINWMLKLLKGPLLGRVGRYYITKDNGKTLLLLKMNESYAGSDHLATVERLKGMVRAQGFAPVMVGGTYLLYGKLSQLVAASLVKGLTLLIVLFAVMAGIISRSARVMGAALLSLGCIPVLMLGVFGYFRVPVDIISAPGANIAIGIGVDAMIHVLIWVRRYPAGDVLSPEAWRSVCSRLWKPVIYSMSVVSAGFAIFMLSGFPPTQRFGGSVVFGTLLSPLPALLLLPWIAARDASKNKHAKALPVL